MNSTGNWILQWILVVACFEILQIASATVGAEYGVPVIASPTVVAR